MDGVTVSGWKSRGDSRDNRSSTPPDVFAELPCSAGGIPQSLRRCVWMGQYITSKEELYSSRRGTVNSRTYLPEGGQA